MSRSHRRRFHLDVPRAFYEAYMGNGADTLLFANRPLFRWDKVVDNGETLRIECIGPCPASAVMFMGLVEAGADELPMAERRAVQESIVRRLDSLHARHVGERKARRKAKNARARAGRKRRRR